MENRKPDTISYFDHEEQMAREERHTNRWRIAAIVLFFSLLASLVYIVYTETQYEDFVTVTQDVDTESAPTFVNATGSINIDGKNTADNN